MPLSKAVTIVLHFGQFPPLFSENKHVASFVASRINQVGNAADFLRMLLVGSTFGFCVESETRRIVCRVWTVCWWKIWPWSTTSSCRRRPSSRTMHRQSPNATVSSFWRNDCVEMHDRTVRCRVLPVPFFSTPSATMVGRCYWLFGVDRSPGWVLVHHCLQPGLQRVQGDHPNHHLTYECMFGALLGVVLSLFPFSIFSLRHPPRTRMERYSRQHV